MKTATTRALGLSIAAGATALVGACAATTPQQHAAQLARTDERQCFNSSMVNGFNPVDRDTVRVTVGARTVYELKTIGYCPQIDWSRQIAIRSTGGSDWICRGFDADLLVPSAMSGGPLDRCPVTSVRRLSPEELQARRAPRGR